MRYRHVILKQGEKSMFKKGFTLAEVLITLLIIGIIAALTIPSVIANAQQQEFKTGLKKAVSVLNEAIQLNISQEGETPYENTDIKNYFKRHMNVIKEVHLHWNPPLYWWNFVVKNNGSRLYQANYALYTADGMRFEFATGSATSAESGLALHESNVKPCGAPGKLVYHADCSGCGSYGLSNNPNGTTKPPCIIMVDVNGDKKPYPANTNCRNASCSLTYYPKVNSNKVIDLFTIMITDEKAIPFGVVAQRAMYSK